MFTALVVPLFVLVCATGLKAAVLVDFQVAQPPPLPRDAKTCTLKILQ